MLYLNVYLLQTCKKHLCCNLFWVPIQLLTTVVLSSIMIFSAKLILLAVRSPFVFFSSVNESFSNSYNLIPSGFNTGNISYLSCLNVTVLILCSFTLRASLNVLKNARCTCSCCPYLYFGSAIMLVTYFVNFR